MKKPVIAVVSGGYSGEHVVSIKTGKNISNHLRSLDKYVIYEIIVDRKEWFAMEDDNKIMVDRNDFSLTLSTGKVSFDAVFLTIHGTPGEDGKLLGYLDMMGIPYAMCGVLPSAITFNKKMANQFLQGKNITHIAKSRLVRKHSPWSVDGLLEELKLPVFVKPNEGGSSLATFKVKEPSELETAINQALSIDDQVIVEEFIEGREFSVGVFDNRGTIQALPVTELISSKEFFDFEAKYTPGMTTEVTPADIPNSVRDRIQLQAVQIFNIFQCEYFVRIDFIWRYKTDEIFFLEVNTMPGQSDASIFPQQIREFGMSLPDFYDLMLSTCLDRSKKN